MIFLPLELRYSHRLDSSYSNGLVKPSRRIAVNQYPKRLDVEAYQTVSIKAQDDRRSLSYMRSTLADHVLLFTETCGFDAFFLTCLP